MKIVGAATPERGITVLSKKEEDEAIAYADSAKVAGKCKFVPASGAASRMFKDIFSGLDKLEKGESLPADAPVYKLAANIEKFAFYDEKVFGKPADGDGYARKVAAALLLDEGLGYGAKPKGVLDFHRYPEEVRTSFAEHLVEAQDYMRNDDGSVTLCVTISPEHRPLFEAAFAKVKDEYEKRYGVRYDVEFTYQDKATDTIAVDMDNKPFLTNAPECCLDTLVPNGFWIQVPVSVPQIKDYLPTVFYYLLQVCGKVREVTGIISVNHSSQFLVFYNMDSIKGNVP